MSAKNPAEAVQLTVCTGVDQIRTATLPHGGITPVNGGDMIVGSYVLGATSGAYGTVTLISETSVTVNDVIGTFQAEQIDVTDTLNGSISDPGANVTSSGAGTVVLSGRTTTLTGISPVTDRIMDIVNLTTPANVALTTLVLVTDGFQLDLDLDGDDLLVLSCDLTRG